MTSTQLPSLVGGRYRPIRLLGRGGMGSVYEAEHAHTGERVALKVISTVLAGPEAVERFRREARAFAAIKSPHVARVTDAGTAPELDDAPFFAMELLAGEDLAARVARDGPQRPDDVAEWLEQAARALVRAHELGIVHRDLKPANLFLAEVEGERVLKVLDFGVAKISDASAQTASGAILGTPRYMAPEQARGEGARVTPAADVWSLAMIAFALLAGRPYFRAEGVAGVLSSVLFDPMEPPSKRGCDLGPAFDAWFLRCTAREVSERESSIAAAARDLAVALAGRERLGTAPTDAAAAATLSVGDAAATDDSKSVQRSASIDVAEPRRRGPAVWWGAGAAALITVAAATVAALRAPAPRDDATPTGSGAVRPSGSAASVAPGDGAPSATATATPTASEQAPPRASSSRTPPTGAASSEGRQAPRPRPPPRPAPRPDDPFAEQR